VVSVTENEGGLVSVDDELGALFDKFEPDGPKSLADLGGVSLLRGREEELARASLMPEVLALAVQALSANPEDECVNSFVVACVSVEVGGHGLTSSSYDDALKALAAANFTPAMAARVQKILTQRADDSEEDQGARWAALGAALQIAISYPATRHRLMGLLVDLPRDEDRHHREFLRRAAKVIGVVNAYWPDEALVNALNRLAGIERARDEASFELGMHHLRRGLEAGSAQQVEQSFDEALECFDIAALSSEYRPDAIAYRAALSMLKGIRRGDERGALRDRAEDISQAVTLRTMWSVPTKKVWPWLGAGWTELFRWRELAMHLLALADDLEAAQRRDPAPDIRRRLLDTYVANRAVLGRDAGGVETYIQPVVKGRLLRIEQARGDLEAWLAEEATNATGRWHDKAVEMLEAMRGGDPPGNGSRMTVNLA
jgi:tetratricopeptide (TPR) repeat protein